MTIAPSHQKLTRLYNFFETYGAERLNGLDESYFVDLSTSEKEEAWKFLARLGLSEETVKGLYILDQKRTTALIKEAIALPMNTSPNPAERQAIESERLSMLTYINSVEPDKKYVAAMCDLANSEFDEIRGKFARLLPIHQITPDAVAALRRMVFTETERIPRTSAITKLMLIHGLDFDMNDPLYKSIYSSLRSDDPKEKLAAMNKLEKIRVPVYV